MESLFNLQHSRRKLDYYQTIEYWKQRVPYWVSEIRAGDHRFAKEIKKVLASLSFNTVIDYGCGLGQASKELFADKQYIGCDITKEMIIAAGKAYPNSRFIWIDPDQSISQYALSADLVFTHTVLEHVPDAVYKFILKSLIDICKIVVIVETDSEIAHWADAIPHGFNHEYLTDLSNYGKVEKVRVKDPMADTNNSVFVLRKEA